METELKKRAQKVAEFRNLKSRPTETQIREVVEVYTLLTGVKPDKDNCNFLCNFYGFVSEINKRLITEPLKIKNMATAKGKFKESSKGITIIRHTKNGTNVINAENLNEGDNFQYVADNYSHLLEGVESDESSEDENLTPKQRLQAEYKELFGEEPESHFKSAELKELIANKQNPENKI